MTNASFERIKFEFERKYYTLVFHTSKLTESS